MRILLLGGTDLTRSVADLVLQLNLDLVGIVYVGETVKISYSPKGMKNVRAGDLEQWCADRNISSYEYTTQDRLREVVAEVNADFCLVVGWYHMIPKNIREKFPLGCAGVHASMLPDLRGCAPLNWAMLSGREKTGVSLFELGDAVDDGDLYAQVPISIAGTDYISDVLQKVEVATIEMLKGELPRIASGNCLKRAQVGEVSYGLARIPDDGRINWNLSADEVAILVRSVSRPYPGAFSYTQGKKVVIWRASVEEKDIKIMGCCGQVARVPELARPVVICSDGYLSIEEVEVSGRILSQREIMNLSNQRFD